MRGAGFKSTTSVGEALRIWLERGVSKVEAEEVRLREAARRVLAETITSTVDVPGFDRSAMDGYAVRAEETFGASPISPLYLNLAGTVSVSGLGDLKVERGEAAEVATGSPIPPGCDAVVMAEHTKVKGRRVEISAQVAPGENVTRRGDDIKRGAVVFRRGHRLYPVDLGVLKALGRRTVMVARKPRTAIIATGDELVSDLEEAKGFKIVDVNSIVISTLVEEAGGLPMSLGIARDNKEEILRKLIESSESADLILISGGTSVGPRDIIPEVVKSAPDSEVTVHGISMRPGMPTALGYLRGKPLVIIPGNPVAAVMAFLNFARPLIDKLTGANPEEPPKVRGILNRRVATGGGMRSFVRVNVSREEGNYRVDPVMVSGSSILTSLAKSNGILEVPEDVEGYEAGDTVEVMLFRAVAKR